MKQAALILQDAQRQAAENALQQLRQEAQSNLDNANAAKAQLQSELITAQQKMASLQKERAEVCCLPLHCICEASTLANDLADMLLQASSQSALTMQHNMYNLSSPGRPMYTHTAIVQ